MSAALSTAASSSGFHRAVYRIDENRGQPAIVLGVAVPLEDLHALDVGEDLAVALSQPPTSRDHLLQPLQLCEAKRGQNVAQPIVVADLGVFVVCNRLPRLRAEIPDALGEPLIIREQCPAPAGGDHLVAVETQNCGGAE